MSTFQDVLARLASLKPDVQPRSAPALPENPPTGVRLSSHIVGSVTVAEAVTSDAAYYDGTTLILAKLVHLMHQRGQLSTADVLALLSPNWSTDAHDPTT